MDYGIAIRVPVPFAEAAARARDALKAQGFGALTEIDAQAASVRNHGIAAAPPPGA